MANAVLLAVSLGFILLLALGLYAVNSAFHLGIDMVIGLLFLVLFIVAWFALEYGVIRLYIWLGKKAVSVGHLPFEAGKKLEVFLAKMTK